MGNFEPGTDIKAQATVLAEGCWGHLTGAAIREFDLAQNREPQVWELGVKEVWKVPKPLDRVIHTFVQPWPLKVSPKYGQIGGTWMYPMKDEKTGEDLVSIGFVVDLNYEDATTSAHDLLQTFKTHPLVKDPRGRRASRLGRQGAARRRLLVDAEAVDARRLARGRRRRHGRHGGAEGRSPLHQVGDARRRVDLRGAEDAAAPTSPTTRRRSSDSSVGKELYEVRNTRQAFQKGLPRRQPARGLRRSCPKASCRPVAQEWHRDDAEPMFIGDTKDRYPKPDGKYTFDKLSSVFITGNATRDDAPNHIRVQKHVPREIAETWRWMCPAGVYEIPEDAPEHGEVDVIVNYTNCVQCGAITAKGGRLTTPEGGDGPLYQIL